MAKESRAGALAIKHPLRVELLSALSAGEQIDAATFAKAHDLTVENARYHLDVLLDAGAITLSDGTARITEQGGALHKLAQRPERRVRDRRRAPRRQEP